MLDNQLFKHILICINAGFASQGIKNAGNGQIDGVKAKQNYQPRTQGANSGPTVYIHKLFDTRIGWPERKDAWIIETGQITHTERQWMESTFQLDGLATQDPADIEGLTASDFVNLAAAIMQSDVTMDYLKTQGLSVLRVRDVRNPYFADDRDRFEASPSFDFTIEHEQVIISTSPISQSTEFNIERV